jgi:hypothetical protein
MAPAPGLGGVPPRPALGPALLCGSQHAHHLLGPSALRPALAGHAASPRPPRGRRESGSPLFASYPILFESPLAALPCFPHPLHLSCLSCTPSAFHKHPHDTVLTSGSRAERAARRTGAREGDGYTNERTAHSRPGWLKTRDTLSSVSFVYSFLLICRLYRAACTPALN